MCFKLDFYVVHNSRLWEHAHPLKGHSGGFKPKPVSIFTFFSLNSFRSISLFLRLSFTVCGCLIVQHDTCERRSHEHGVLTEHTQVSGFFIITLLDRSHCLQELNETHDTSFPHATK